MEVCYSRMNRYNRQRVWDTIEHERLCKEQIAVEPNYPTIQSTLREMMFPKNSKLTPLTKSQIEDDLYLLRLENVVNLSGW